MLLGMILHPKKMLLLLSSHRRWCVASFFLGYSLASLTMMPNKSHISQIPTFESGKIVNSMRRWRAAAERSCQLVLQRINGTFDERALEAKELMEAIAVSSIRLPERSSIGEHPMVHRKHEYSRNVFLDLGTNIGDSIGYFLDSVIDVCSPIWVKANPTTKFDNSFPRPHFDVAQLQFYGKGSTRNPFAAWLQAYIANGVGIS